MVSGAPEAASAESASDTASETAQAHTPTHSPPHCPPESPTTTPSAHSATAAAAAPAAAAGAAAAAKEHLTVSPDALAPPPTRLHAAPAAEDADKTLRANAQLCENGASAAAAEDADGEVWENEPLARPPPLETHTSSTTNSAEGVATDAASGRPATGHPAIAPPAPGHPAEPADESVFDAVSADDGHGGVASVGQVGAGGVEQGGLDEQMSGGAVAEEQVAASQASQASQVSQAAVPPVTVSDDDTSESCASQASSERGGRGSSPSSVGGVSHPSSADSDRVSDRVAVISKVAVTSNWRVCPHVDVETQRALVSSLCHCIATQGEHQPPPS